MTIFDLPGGLQGNEDKTIMYCLEHEMDITHRNGSEEQLLVTKSNSYCV